ncbi:MAG: 2'-deoxycytidine 5'-triphosphate deaminase [Candidatus Pacebacteria bacterium]|nr:2'-deoxycytidine 5'-triphosphate deaminase [Candidatus Paceibacterota bacterium]
MSHSPAALNPQLRGILTGRSAEAFVRCNHDLPLEPGQIQPASIDLRLGRTAFRTRASFLPGVGRMVEQGLADLTLHQFSLDDGAVLEKGAVYVVPLEESLAIPAGLSGVANPKSSTGRLDVFARVIVDGSERFDQIPEGYRGRVFVEISPHSFPITVRRGSKLVQLRLRSGGAAEPIGEAILGLDARGKGRGQIIGYRAKGNTGLVDVDCRARYAVADYWEVLTADTSGAIILDPGEFYILATESPVVIPNDQVAELRPLDTEIGEFRVHYAGFFDPGFGVTNPSRGVLEVRAHEVPFRIEHGQTIGKLIYEKLLGTPESLYGSGIQSNYQGQGLKLSKHFI